MNTVLAAIDDSTAAAPVLAVAQAMARILDTSLEVLHVQEGDKATAAAVAEQGGVDLHVVEGDPVAQIVEAAALPSVVLVVVGTRGHPSGPRPAGHIAMHVAERSNTPVLVVPPDFDPPDVDQPIRRALIPLEGSPESTDAVAASLQRLAAAGVELIGVHVFNDTSVPRFWDEPGHAEQSWAAEFADRWCTEAGLDLHLRRGAAPQTIVDVADAEKVDLIALGWSQDLSPGRADVVRTALTHSCVPVLLVPVTTAARSVAS